MGDNKLHNNLLLLVPLVLPLFCMIVIAIYYALIFNRQLNETYFLSVATIVIILYVFGLLNFPGSLLIGYILIVSLAMLILFIVVKKYLVDKKAIEKIAYRYGILLFLLSLGVSLFINYGRVFSTWDEFSHWGTVVKHMYYYDALATIPDSALYIQSYLPGTSLFQYFFCRPFNQFIEYPAYVAFNLMIVALVLPFLSSTKRIQAAVINLCKNAFDNRHNLPQSEIKIYDISFLIVVILFLSIPLALDAKAYSTLYVDSFLGLLFGSTFLYYFYYRYENSLFGILMVTATLGLLTMAKHVGLVLAIIAIAVIIIDLFLFRRDILRGYIATSMDFKKRLKQIVLMSSPILMVAFVQLTWRLLIAFAGISERTSISAVDLKTLIQGELLPYQIEVWNNFIAAAVSRYPLLVFGISYLDIFVLSIIITIGYGYFFSTKRTKLTRPTTIIVIVILGFLLYAAFILVAYMFVFSQYEAVRLASYNRYMRSYVIGLFIAMLILIVELPEEKCWQEKISSIVQSKYLPAILVTGIIIGFFVTGIALMTPKRYIPVKATIEGREPFNQVYEWSNFIVENSDKRIAVIAQGGRGYEIGVLNYLIYPNSFAAGYSVARENYFPPYTADDEYPQLLIIEPEEWSKLILENYDYLYLFRVDTQFIETYGSYFDYLKTGMIYEATTDKDSNLLLKAVAK